MESELKPCPLCGSVCTIQTVQRCYEFYVAIECTKCGYSVSVLPFDERPCPTEWTKQKVIDMHNHRSSQTTLDKEEK